MIIKLHKIIMKIFYYTKFRATQYHIQMKHTITFIVSRTQAQVWLGVLIMIAP